MTVEERVLDRISPSPEYRREVEGAVRSIVDSVRTASIEMGLRVDVLPVGSVAKDTYLISTDIDVFILFDKDTPKEVLERDGLEIGKRVVDGEEKYAEHPYVHGRIDGFDVDVVPCFKLDDTSELRSSVDRTPFHLKYVLEHLAEEQRDQVRLLKGFMKGIGVYGAEAKVEGFSGYMTELLVMRYGAFHDVLENAARWTPGINLWLDEEGDTRFKDPLVFYDPVDPRRNVASALSLDSFATFIHSCKEYLADERIEFFFPHEREPLGIEEMTEALSERGTSIVIASFDRPDIIDDNLYPQVRKTHDGVLNLLRDNDFVILDSKFHVEDKVHLVFELEEDVLPRCKRHVGPPIWIDHSERFLQKWSSGGMSEPFIEGGRWIVLVPREYTNSIDLLENLMEKAALGSEFKELPGLTVTGGDDVFNPAHQRTLSALLDKRKNWEIG